MLSVLSVSYVSSAVTFCGGSSPVVVATTIVAPVVVGNHHRSRFHQRDAKPPQGVLWWSIAVVVSQPLQAVQRIAYNTHISRLLYRTSDSHWLTPCGALSRHQSLCASRETVPLLIPRKAALNAADQTVHCYSSTSAPSRTCAPRLASGLLVDILDTSVAPCLDVAHDGEKAGVASVGEAAPGIAGLGHSDAGIVRRSRL